MYRQIRFRLGLCPRTRWGAYSAPPDSLAGFKGPTSKGAEGKGKEGRPAFSVQFVGNPTRHAVTQRMLNIPHNGRRSVGRQRNMSPTF